MTNIPSKTIKYGRNRDNVPFADDKYVKCWNCGFICHLSRDGRASIGSRAGDGITHEDALNGWGAAPYGSKQWGGATRDDPTVNDGCPLCGCLHYDRRE